MEQQVSWCIGYVSFCKMQKYIIYTRLTIISSNFLTHLMNPLIILSAQHKRVLLPHEALPDSQPDVVASSPEVVPFGVGVEDVERCSRLHVAMDIVKRLSQELPEVAV